MCQTQEVSKSKVPGWVPWQLMETRDKSKHNFPSRSSSGGGSLSLIVIQGTCSLTQALQFDVLTQVTSTPAFETQCPLWTVVTADALSISQSDRCQPENISQLERPVAVSVLDDK